MNHALASRESHVGGAEDARPTPTATLPLSEALEVVARHVAFVQAGLRTSRDPLVLDLVRSDVDRALAAAGLVRRVDDRGDEWAELDGRPVAWLGHRPELQGSDVRP